MHLPQDHPLRIELNDEVHARPPEPLTPPQRISYLVLLSEGVSRDTELEQLSALVERFGGALPGPDTNHYSADLGAFRIKWERHTEFVRYKFIVAGLGEHYFATPAISEVPQEWLAALSGRLMLAANVAHVRDDGTPLDFEATATQFFDGNVLIGSSIADSAGTALTDLRIHDDGFSRILLLDRSMTVRQAGRTVQRLLEIDTYRIMALLALPVARGLAPFLSRCEEELARLTTDLTEAKEADEQQLLDRLTGLASEIASQESASRYRFGAAAAYHQLVLRRIGELREQRIQGLQTFNEFTERRMAPAMNTCRAVAARLESLYQQVSQATQLLSTRVDMTRERQNQALLESMDRRARLQLRLQQTVEGLSIAAITYYVVSLVGYAAKGLKYAGIAVDADRVTAASIPIVVLLVWLGVRRARKMLTRE